MESLANLEAFVRSARTGSFSGAARRLALTPAAVSRNVAMLERNLGVRLFQRSTRRLTLTEAGERFLPEIEHHLAELQAAIGAVASDRGEPAGTLKVSMSLAFGLDHMLPLLPEFRRRYPLVRTDWRFESRQVDLIAEGLDAAIGGGFELGPDIVARTLTPVHVIAVAAPGFMAGHRPPADPSDLAAFDGIVLRSSRTGRALHRTMRNAAGVEAAEALKETMIVNDSAALVRAAVLGLGVAMVAVPDALPHLENGALTRLLPKWYADLGAISLYYASRTLLPAKTRVFVDFVSEEFRRNRLAERFAGSLG